MEGKLFKKSFSESLPRKLFCTTRKASDFELPGTPTTKMGILFKIETTIITTFSLSELFHAMPGSVRMLDENSFNVSSTTWKNPSLLNDKESNKELEEFKLEELRLEELKLEELELDELEELELDELESSCLSSSVLSLVVCVCRLSSSSCFLLCARPSQQAAQTATRFFRSVCCSRIA